MDARELRDDLSPHRNASWTIIGDEDRATILRALDLLAAVEGSQDERVRELQLRVRGQRGEVANCMNKAAAALVAERAAKEKAEAELASVKAELRSAKASIVAQSRHQPRHRYWAVGDPDCPPEIKAPNGELHTLRCKVCGKDNPTNGICRAAHPKDAQ